MITFIFISLYFLMMIYMFIELSKLNYPKDSDPMNRRYTDRYGDTMHSLIELTESSSNKDIIKLCWMENDN